MRSNLCRDTTMDPQFCPSNHVCLHSQYEMCPTLPDQKFINNECPRKANLALDTFFHCLNRGDATDMFHKILFKKTISSPNLNELLDANENGFTCKKDVFLSWTVTDLNIIGDHRDRNFIRTCILNNQEKIDRVQLVRLLKNDQAFEFHEKVPQNWKPNL